MKHLSCSPSRPDKRPEDRILLADPRVRLERRFPRPQKPRLPSRTPFQEPEATLSNTSVALILPTIAIHGANDLDEKLQGGEESSKTQFKTGLQEGLAVNSAILRIAGTGLVFFDTNHSNGYTLYKQQMI